MKLYHFLKNSFHSNRNVILWVNICYFGLVGVGMLLVAAFPNVQASLVGNVTDELSSLMDSLNQMTGGAFAGWVSAPNLWVVLAGAAAIFIVNLILGSLIEITLPSLVIPFSGLVLGVVRAFLWGLLFSPFNAQGWVSLPVFLIQLLLLLLEGEGYVLALSGVVVHGKGLFFPHSLGEVSHWRGYVQGLKHSLALLLCGGLVLIVAALYESIMVFWVIPRLAG